MRVLSTDADNLIGSLRGEVGEVIVAWTLLRQFMSEAHSLRTADLTDARSLRTTDLLADMNNPAVAKLEILTSKLRDDVVARLAELAEEKIGQLTFHFATVKLGVLAAEATAFTQFIRKNGFEEKRNSDISHKVLPEKWSDHRHRHIPYNVVTQAVARATRLMKQIDRRFLGPAAPYLWAELRKKRYQPTPLPRVAYLLLPHMRLPPLVRAAIIAAEEREGIHVWTEMPTTLNGSPSLVKVSREWGGILLPTGLIMVEDYPVNSLHSITSSGEGGERPPKSH